MKIDGKSVLLYSIVPALVAGLFSVAPKIYEVISEPRASLSYKLVEGPKISINGEQQQVLSVTVKNNGSRALTAIRAELSVQGSIILASSVSSSSGLPLVNESFADKVLVSSKKIHEGEHFSISALIKSPKGTIIYPVSFTARSDEVLGVSDQGGAVKSSRWELLGPFLAALSVFFMSFAVQRKANISGSAIGVLNVYDRDDIIFYISIATDTQSVISEYEAARQGISYLRYAEKLLKHGVSGGDAARANAISALKCLLMIRMARSSKEIVERNLRLLVPDELSNELVVKLKEIGAGKKSPLEIREIIDSLVSGRLVFS